MQLGAFSVSLTVKEIGVSKAFYEKLGFREISGNIDEKWLIMQNGYATVGLFEGMFDRNILTFNPGWGQDGNTLDSYTDIRELQSQLAATGVKFETRADPESTGPASFVLIDPDGNPILVDQHF